MQTIRQAVISDCMEHLPRPLSFSRFLIVNLVAIGLLGVLALAAMSGEPRRLGAPYDILAQIVARLFAGP